MAIVTLPTNFAFSNIGSFRLQRASNTLRSKYTGQRQTILYPFAVWMIEGELRDYDGADAGKIRSFLGKLEGQANSFRLPVPGFSLPLSGYASNLNISADALVRSNVVTVSGGTANAAYLAEGDYITIQDELKLVTSLARLDASGNSTVNFTPPLRKAASVGTTLVSVNPTVLLTAADDDVADWSVGPPVRQGGSFKAIEDITTVSYSLSIAGNYYANSAYGSDANIGTEEAPFATLAYTLSKMQSGKVADLEGSWREALEPVLANLTFVNNDGLAIIDGADVATGWTAHASAANVWEKTNWTHNSASGAIARLTIYEDGMLLKRVADVAACSATAGTFVDIKESDGLTLTLRIHPTGNGNPNSNGKVYEATKRKYAFAAIGNNLVVSGIYAKRAIDNNGAFAVTGFNSDVSRVLSEYGTKHNILIFTGKVKSSIAFNSDPPTAYQGSNTSYVAFLPTGASGPYEFAECGAVQSEIIGTAFNGQVAFFAHAATVGPLFTSGTLRQCWGVGAVYGGHSGGAAGLQVEEGCYWNAQSMIARNDKYTVRYTLGFIPTTIAGVATPTNTLGEQTFIDSCYYFGPRINTSAPVFQMNGRDSDNDMAAILDHSVFVMGYSVSYGAHMFATGTANGGTVTSNYAIIAGSTGYALWIGNGIGYVGNNNIFWTKNQYHTEVKTYFQYHGVEYDTLAAWQTATGQDANSCYVKFSDQAAGNVNALFLAWKNAPGGTDINTIGPGAGDFRINPTARVYSGADVAYIGTFPNGAAITLAGAQNKWDWNDKQVVSGAPTRFPTVPKTLAESIAYCKNPDDWTF